MDSMYWRTIGGWLALALLAGGAPGCRGESGPCAPQCGVAECGVDPVCGQSCGACADGFACTEAQRVADAPVCPGYTGFGSCCVQTDVCGLAGDGACDCQGACAWDQADCARACGADGLCDVQCPADPDCVPGCACDHVGGACESGAPCQATPCACDGDCGSGASACAADAHCDPWCPRLADPDCAGTPDDGAACCAPACAGRECGDDGCGDSCGACREGLDCVEGACIPLGCGAVEDVGCCEGSVVIWCEDGQLWQVDCAAEYDPPEDTCGWTGDEVGYDCGGVGADPGGAYPLTCP